MFVTSSENKIINQFFCCGIIKVKIDDKNVISVNEVFNDLEDVYVFGCPNVNGLLKRRSTASSVPNLENQRSVRYWPKKALFGGEKRAPKISPSIQSLFYVFCIKIKLSIIFTNEGSVRLPDAQKV